MGLVATVALVACGGSDKKTATTTDDLAPDHDPGDRHQLHGGGQRRVLRPGQDPQHRHQRCPGGSTAQLKADLEKADKAIHKAVDVAPAEIKPDVKVIADGFTTVVSAIAGVNYDLTKVPPEALATFQTPEFSNSAARLQAYMTDVCKVRK